MSFTFRTGNKGINAIEDSSKNRYTVGSFTDNQYLFINGNIIESATIDNNMSLSKYSSGYNALRVSPIDSVFDYKFQGQENPRFWDKILTGGATTTLNNTTSALEFNAPIGGRVVHQTKEYFEYQASKIQQYLFTGVLEVSGGVTGSISRIGSFDDANDKSPVSTNDRGGDGHFFELDGTDLYVVQRKSTDSSPFQSDTRVHQDDWNIDKLDGTGPSGFTLDVSKANIYTIKRKWLGVGGVCLGIVVNGVIYYCHEFENNNINDTTYMKRANLPIRYELDNTGGSAPSELRQVCCSYGSVGGFDPQTEIFSANTGTISQSTSNEHYISIRLKAETNRQNINLNIFNLAAPTLGSSDSALVKVVLNPTLNITGSWTSADPESVAEILTGTDATFVSGGTIVYQDYITRFRELDLSIVNDKITFQSDIAGNQDVISILVDEVLGSTLSSTQGVLVWNENI